MIDFWLLCWYEFVLSNPASSRGVQRRPDLSCLWKLLGDACSLSGTVAPERAHVLVPGALSGDGSPDQNHRLDQRTLLRLGERWASHTLTHTCTPSPHLSTFHHGLGFYQLKLCKELAGLICSQTSVLWANSFLLFVFCKDDPRWFLISSG